MKRYSATDIFMAYEYGEDPKEDPQGKYCLYEDVPQWVSVEERQPEKEGRYVVVYRYKDKFSRMFIGDFYIEKGCHFWASTGIDTVITHWYNNMQPLPQPPEDSDDD